MPLGLNVFIFGEVVYDVLLYKKKVCIVSVLMLLWRDVTFIALTISSYTQGHNSLCMETKQYPD